MDAAIRRTTLLVLLGWAAWSLALEACSDDSTDTSDAAIVDAGRDASTLRDANSHQDAQAGLDGGSDQDGTVHPNCVLSYGFEDWAGSADDTPGYPLGAWDEEKWTAQKEHTRVLGNCGSWQPHSGNYFLYGDWYDGSQDSCLGGTGGAPYLFLGADTAFGNNADFLLEQAVTGTQVYLKFWVIMGDGWKTNTNHCVKFVRTRWAGGPSADLFANIVFYCGDDNYLSTGGVGEGYWDGSFHLDDLGINLADGSWHEFAVWQDIARLLDDEPGPIQIKVWVDGHLIIDRDVPVDAAYVKANGPISYRHIYLLENFCGTTNDGPVTYGIDDMELCDDIPSE
ncbi:MAG: hypothetical protein J7M25_16085 [Deltaproteobacteria bacterium]|nr:hypothetical protein [Deltaproteobacteria bacterium]